VRLLTEPVTGSGSEDNDEGSESKTDDDLNDWDDAGTWDDEDATEVEPISETDYESSAERELRSEKVKARVRGVDAYLDNLLSRATGTAERSREKLEEYTPKFKHGVKKVTTTTKGTFKALDKFGDKYSRRIFSKNIFDGLTGFIIDKPKLIIFIILALTIATVFWGILGIPPKMEEDGVKVKLQDNIRGDFEVYLPQDHETKIIIDEIQKYWSTDIIIGIVETPNALPFDDPDHASDKNITDISVLKEMSKLEDKFNPDREEDRSDDGIVTMLSFSSIVKMLNSTGPRFQKAIINEFPNIPELDLGYIEGGYSIPDDPERIKIIFEQMGQARNRVILDSNGDTIYDTGIILIGITQDIDQEQLVSDMREEVKEYNQSQIVLTGPIPMTQAITKRTYEEFTKTLPAAILVVAGVLMLFHRTWKIVIITGVPVLCSLAITFGILGGTNMTLTPQVVLIAPILIALGVAYGLYIANRYSDEAHIEDRKERIQVAVRTTGKAIFLSALTTAIGFASLLTVQMIPLQVLGFGLSMGIMICYAVTMLTVPSLVMALDYRKKGEIKVKEKIGNVPILHRKKIIAGAFIFVIISVILIPYVQANMNFIKMAPQDEPVIIKMREYSEKFGGGQQGMIMVEGEPAPPGTTNVDDSMRDFETLKEIDKLETKINQVENTNALSIVDFMKMIKPPGEFIEPFEALLESYTGIEIDLNISFWNLIENAPTIEIPGKGKSLQLIMIDVFYNTLTIEIRGMFINDDYSSTLLYIDMPTMDVVNTKKAVNEVNEVTEQYSAGRRTSHLTGFGAILVAINDMLVYNAIQSTIIALILVFVVLAIIFKSIKFSAITLIPVCMVVILQPITLIGIGGLGGLINPEDPFFTGELNLFTAVIGSIIVGIGIDFGIHMTERIRERGFTLEGIRYGVSTSGMAFVEATVTMLGGLSAVFLVNIPAIQEFILLIMILLIYSVIGALFILPAIYTLIVRAREARQKRLAERTEMGRFKDSYMGEEDKRPISTNVQSFEDLR